MELSKKIEKLRKKKGLSQEQLADQIGVSRQSVFKWESGVNTPDIDKLKKLTEIFNVSFDVLLNDEIDIDDNYQINEQPKPVKKVNKKAIFIPIIVFLSLCITGLTTFLIVRGVQQGITMVEDNVEVDRVISLINQIGEVDLDSEPRIIEAEEAYNKLSDSQKEKVTNYSVLVEARETYDQLAFLDREEKTKNDPTRNIKLSDINGTWKTGNDEWKIADVSDRKSVLYWTSSDPNGHVISANLKDSYIVGYNNKTMYMEIKLYHYYAFGEEFLDIGVRKDSSSNITITFQDKTFTKIA